MNRFSQQFAQGSAIDQLKPHSKAAKIKSLIEPLSELEFETLIKRSQQITKQNFGDTMRVFAPLYISNECINNCQYCGFSRDNPILRVTLSVEECVQEAKFLYDKGFRNILLVAGEHPKFVSQGYLQECIKAIKSFIPSIGVEVGPMEQEQYVDVVKSGAESLIVYQETYHHKTYTKLHTAGPKKDFDWRLDCPERAYEAGFRRIGIGALFGMTNWKHEAISLAMHLEHLYKLGWQAQWSIAFPRMRKHAGDENFSPKAGHELSDRHLKQLIAAFRCVFPQVNIVLSTRENEKLRNELFHVGVTHLSAGSQTEPGGYTGAGQKNLHHTVKGRQIALPKISKCDKATEQFSIEDKRPIEEVAHWLKTHNYEVVWKDFDACLLETV